MRCSRFHSAKTWRPQFRRCKSGPKCVWWDRNRKERLRQRRSSPSSTPTNHEKWQEQHRFSSIFQQPARPETLEFANYVIVFTTCSSGSAADVLRSYRMRWQIELVFKPLKSLAQLGHLPKHDEHSSRAWLYGKLFVTLLASTKTDAHRARYFPLGLHTLGVGDHVVRRVNSVSRFTKSSRQSNHTFPCSKHCIRGIRLHKLLRKGRATDYFNWCNEISREYCARPTGAGCLSEADLYADSCDRPTSSCGSSPASRVTYSTVPRRSSSVLDLP